MGAKHALFAALLPAHGEMVDHVAEKESPVRVGEDRTFPGICDGMKGRQRVVNDPDFSNKG